VFDPFSLSSRKRKQQRPPPVQEAGKRHTLRPLVGCNPRTLLHNKIEWVCKETDMQASHLAVGLSVSDSLACIKHKPGKETLDGHFSVTFKTWPKSETLGIHEESVTREDKDKAGCQSSDQRDHPTDIWDEEGEDERDNKPHQRLQDPPPLLTAHTHLHLLALETQPKSFYDCPGEGGGAGGDTGTRGWWRNAALTELFLTHTSNALVVFCITCLAVALYHCTYSYSSSLFMLVQFKHI